MCIRSGANQGCVKKSIVIANGLIWIPVHNDELQQDQASSANRSQVTCTFERSPVFVSEQSDVGLQCPFIDLALNKSNCPVRTAELQAGLKICILYTLVRNLFARRKLVFFLYII